MMSTPDIGRNTEPDDTTNGTSTSQSPGKAIKRHKNLILAIASGLSLFLLLASWAWIVPPKSAPDDDFHLTTTWCAWGDSQHCIQESATSVRVPDQLIGLNCRSFDFTIPDAQCKWTAPFKFTSTDRFRPSTGYSSPIFYQVQRVFVSDDIEASTLRMRLFNAGLASVLFAAAMWVTSSTIRRSLALTWMIVATPLVAFTIASTTPQSWAVTGVALSWVFFAAWLTARSEKRLQNVIALAGLFITLTMAATARSDAALFLLFTYTAVIALLWRRRRDLRNRFLTVIVPIFVIASLGLSYRASALIPAISSRPESGSSTFPSHLLVSMLADLPAFFAGLTGFFPASDVPWDGHVSWGLGWEGFPSPSFSYLAFILALGGAVTWGIHSVSPPRLSALAVLVIALLLIPIATVVWSNKFQTGVQLRYFLPLLLVAIPFLLMRSTRPGDSLTKTQLGLLVLLSATGSVVTFVSTTVRYEVGLTPLWDVAWARVWFDPASPFISQSLTLSVGGLAAVVFVATSALQVVASQSPEHHSPKALPEMTDR